MDVSLDALTEAGFLPAEAPIGMPTQSLAAHPERFHRNHEPRTRPPGLWARRAFVFGGAIALTLFGAYEMNLVLNSMGVSTLGVIVLVLFVVLGAWIALSFMSALGGFASMLSGGGLGLGIAKHGPLPKLSSRTAILMPTYNEEPSRVLAGLRAICESIHATGQGAAFDVFVLSDTTNPDVWIEEEQAFLALRARLSGKVALYYRRRAKNTDRKAGNLAEWVKRFGGAYRQMLTLDADSLMDGGVIVRIVAAMEAHEDVGLIQTLPIIAGGRTLFARMQQFAGRVYGPLIAQGIAWWHGSEGNYWGHNAIIRTQAFAEQAGLPHLTGRPPFGGHILSHDFVEAALMRRGGWAIHMVPALIGSFEESPPSLTDVAIRDRRWCQGNLQHYKLLNTRGMHWVSRLHMLMGIGSYITSPLWLLFLLCGILISLQAHFYRPSYFGYTKTLYPHWPQVDPVQAKWVFIGTMAVLLVPKILAFIALCFDRASLKASGGFIRVFISIVLETLLGGLIAPIAMLIQTTGVLSILLGRDSGWNAQKRDDAGVPLSEIARNYWVYTAFGGVLAVCAWVVSHALFFWMTPVLIGLGLAIPLAALTASRDAGLGLRAMGLLTIVEETEVPDVMIRAYAAQEHARGGAGEACALLRADPTLAAVHRANLPAPRGRGEPIDANLLVGLVKLREAASIAEAVNSLTAREKAAVLADDEGVSLILGLA